MGKHKDVSPKLAALLDEPEVIKEETVEEVVETEVEPELEEVVEVKTYATVYDCDLLNVRKEPSMSGDVAEVLIADTIVEVLPVDGNDEWYQVKRDERLLGYSMRKYLMNTVL